MYRQFFGFTDEVFSPAISEEALYKTDSFSQLMNRFEYLKKHRGIMLLTGNPGTGKTSSIRAFLSTLSAKSFTPVYLPLSTVAVGDFYKQLNTSLNGERVFGKSETYKSIQKQVITYAVNRKIIPVIVLDEVHLLKDQNFQELQIISNFQYDTISPAIFILSGQTVVKERLRGYHLESFNQRISMRYHIHNLNAQETQQYILHHFSICNCKEEILNGAAFEAIFKISAGIPRIIGNVVTKALMLAATQKVRIIDEEIVFKASQEVL